MQIAKVFPLFVALTACGGGISTDRTTVPPAPAPTIATHSNQPPDITKTGPDAQPPVKDPNAIASDDSGLLTIPDPMAPNDTAKKVSFDGLPGTTATLDGPNATVMNGAHFAFVVKQGTDDLHERMKALASSMPNSHVEKIKDDLLIYTGIENGRGGYHFEALVTLGKSSYVCSDAPALKIELTRTDVDSMVRVCKTMK
ncbi:MAG: hypothetical protein ABI551_08140 [Polyangiaceae bacterium]